MLLIEGSGKNSSIQVEADRKYSANVLPEVQRLVKLLLLLLEDVKYVSSYFSGSITVLNPSILIYQCITNGKIFKAAGRAEHIKKVQ